MEKDQNINPEEQNNEPQELSTEEQDNKGEKKTVENIEEVKEDHNENLKLDGIVVNQFQSRANQPNRVVNELRAEKLPLLDSYIGSSIKMRESHEAQLPLINFAPSHKLTKQFIALHCEIEKKSQTK